MTSEFAFSRSRADSPGRLSIVCLNKDHADYLEDNLLSVAAQKFGDFEYLVADGGSTDGSLDILSKHAFVTVLPGSDSSRDEGVLRAISAASADYVMFTTSTDGYLTRNWFAKVVETLDGDGEVSLVWGGYAGSAGG